MYPERKKGLKLSATLHFLFLLLILFDLPSLLSPKPPEEPVAITVEILPITGVTNVKPPEKTADETKPEEKKPDAKPSPPVKTADNTPPPPPPPPKPAEKPIQKPAEKTPEPKKEDKKPKPKPQDLAAVLKAVKDTAQKDKTDQKDKKDSKDTTPDKTVFSNSPYNPELPMSLSEKDAIMSQLAACWNVPAGAKNAQDLVILIDAEYASDGTNIKVALARESAARYNSDSFFRAAADAAIRAVKQCSPLKNLAPEKYETWHYMELRFDPKYMLN